MFVYRIWFGLNSIRRSPLRIERQSELISKNGASDNATEWLLIPLQHHTIRRVRLSHNHDGTFPPLYFFDLPEGGSDDVDGGTGVCDSV